MTGTRRDEIERALDDVRARVRRACQQAGRSPDDVTLVVVTKRFPATDVVHLADLGVRDVGESRDQEARAKVAQVAELLQHADAGPRHPLTWHFVGQLQRNKVASVARYAQVVHSVDRSALVQALGRAAQGAGRELDVLLQVDLETRPQQARGGAYPHDLPQLAQEVAGAGGLKLRGLMAVAPLGADPAPAFERLAVLGERLRSDYPEARWLSAGMTGDFEQAVACGATHLRVGSAVLGSRPPLR